MAFTLAVEFLACLLVLIYVDKLKCQDFPAAMFQPMTDMLGTKSNEDTKKLVYKLVPDQGKLMSLAMSLQSAPNADSMGINEVVAMMESQGIDTSNFPAIFADYGVEYGSLGNSGGEGDKAAEEAAAAKKAEEEAAAKQAEEEAAKKAEQEAAKKAEEEAAKKAEEEAAKKAADDAAKKAAEEDAAKKQQEQENAEKKDETPVEDEKNPDSETDQTVDDGSTVDDHEQIEDTSDKDAEIVANELFDYNYDNFENYYDDDSPLINFYRRKEADGGEPDMEESEQNIWSKDDYYTFELNDKKKDQGSYYYYDYDPKVKGIPDNSHLYSDKVVVMHGGGCQFSPMKQLLGACFILSFLPFAF